jgi:hypothetical protein
MRGGVSGLLEMPNRSKLWLSWGFLECRNKHVIHPRLHCFDRIRDGRTNPGAEFQEFRTLNPIRSRQIDIR